MAYCSKRHAYSVVPSPRYVCLKPVRPNRPRRQTACTSARKPVFSRTKAGAHGRPPPAQNLPCSGRRGDALPLGSRLGPVDACSCARPRGAGPAGPHHAGHDGGHARAQPAAGAALASAGAAPRAPDPLHPPANSPARLAYQRPCPGSTVGRTQPPFGHARLAAGVRPPRVSTLSRLALGRLVDRTAARPGPHGPRDNGAVHRNPKRISISPGGQGI